MTPTPFDLSIKKVQAYLEKIGCSFGTDMARQVLVDVLAILEHDRDAWLAHAPEQKQAQPVATTEQVAPPAGESVEDQMRARGWTGIDLHKPTWARWEKMSSIGLNMKIDLPCRRHAWCRAFVGTTCINDFLDPLTAADACERHAAKENAK